MSYIPILFNETTTNYNNNGIAMLSDTIDYYVVEGRNDIFELTLEYPASGKWASELKDWRQILAKPNEKDDPHVFRITEIVKDLNPSTIYVYATSITNDLGGNLVVELSPKNLNGQEVMNVLKANLLNDNRFNFISDIQTRSSTYWYMRNPLNCLVGGEGSFVQYWGGEVKRTNDTIYVYSRRGRDNVTVLRPDKNIEGFTITTSTKSVVTRILPYFSYYSNGDNPQEVVVIGDVVVSPLANNYPIQRIVPVDFTGDESIVDKASLMTKANTYFTTLYPDIDKPDVQIEIDMLQLSDSAFYSKFKGLEQINLTDTITVWIEKYNVDMEVKVVELTYNGMSGRTISLVAGAKAASLYEAQKGEYSSQINNLQKYISTVENGIINVIQESADGKNRIFRGYTEPSPDISKVNDLWFKEIGNGEVEVYTFDGMTWQPMLFAGLGAEIKAEVEEAIRKSEEAKQAAEQSYADSVAEAERLVQVQTDAFDAQMSDVNQEISTVKSDIDTAISNVNQEIANNFTSLSDSISDVDDIATQAKTDAQTALSNAQTAKNDAQTALSNASTALGQAQSAVSTAASANNKAIKSSVVDWALSSSGTTPPTSGWQTSIPTPSSTQYTWGRTTITLNDGTTILSYNVSKIGVKGDKGDTGAGGAKGDKGDAGVNAPKITSVKQQFYLSTSNTTQTGGSWTETIPVWSSGKYYWTRVVTSYDNSTSTPSVAVLDNALNQSLVSALEAKSATQTLSSTVSQHATQIAAKANQTTVDKLTGRVSTAEGSISVQAGEIALKANQTTVDTLAGRVGTAETNISSNTTAINLRATKSSVDTLTGRVTTAEGTITAQAGQIALKANTTTVNALTGRVSTAETNISANTSAINLRATKTELTNAIDGIEVGGRNLVKNTAMKTAWGAYSPMVTTALTANGTKATWGTNLAQSAIQSEIPSDLVNGEKYVIRLKARGTLNNFQMFILTYPTPNYNFYSVKNALNATSFREFTVPFTYNHANKSNLLFLGGTPSASGQWLEIMKDSVKLEKGNKATDWTPAPEDVDASIASVQSNLTVEAGKITALTTRVTGTETNISNVTQTVSGINTTISTLRTDVNGKATIVALNQVKSTADGNKTTISNHAGRLTTVETNVSGLQTTVADKADKSQITQLTTSISTKVESATYNSKMTQLDNAINLRVVKGDVTAAILADKKIKDTRTTNQLPSWYFANYPSQRVEEFKQRATMGVPGSATYVKLVTDVPWNHTSGGVVVQTAYSSDGVYNRSGNSAGTAWGSWVKQTDSSNVLAQVNLSTEGVLIQGKRIQLDGDVTMTSAFTTRLDTQTLSAITANITSIRSKVLVTDSVTSTHLKTEAALVNKIFATDAMVTTLTGKTAFINGIKAITISADKVTTGTLNAANVSIINLNASNIVTGTLDGIAVRSSFSYAYDGAILNQGTTTIGNGQIISAGTFTHSHGSTYLKLSPDGLYGDNLYPDLSIRSLFKLDGTGLMLRTGANIATYNHNGIDFGRGFMRYYSADARIEVGSYNGAALGSFVGGNYLRRITVGGGNDGLDPFVDLWATTTMRAPLNLNFNQLTNANHISGASAILFHNSSNRLIQSADGQLNLLSPSQLNLGWTDGSSTTTVLSVTLNQVSMFRALNLNFNQLNNANHITGANTILFNNTSNRIVQSSDGQLNLLSPNQINLGWTNGSSVTNVLSLTLNQVSMFRNLNMQSNNITNQSDKRLKTNIAPTSIVALDAYRRLNMVDYSWLDPSKPSGRHLGVIAQDTPFWSMYDAETDTWMISSSKQIMYNSLGIKELVSITDRHASDILRVDTYVEQHELEIKLLKDRIKQLEEKIA